MAAPSNKRSKSDQAAASAAGGAVGAFDDGAFVSGFASTLAGVEVLSDFPADAENVIATHSGNFHSDEAMACAMLQCLPRFKGSPIVRTRDMSVVEQAAIAVDVGGQYDVDKLRFDHHQRGFVSTFADEAASDKPSDKPVKMSSAGLVYKHLGREVLANIVGPTLSEQEMDVLYDKIYSNVIREVDAIDNGVEQLDMEGAPGFVYRIGTHLASRVGRLNPAWNQPQTDEVFNACFRRAVQMSFDELHSHIMGIARVWLPARAIVKKAWDTRFEVDPSGQVVVLETGCPWKTHLRDVETEAIAAAEAAGQEPPKQALYCISPHPGGTYRLGVMALAEGSFQLRKPLPKPWCGQRDEALSAASGVPGGVFVHNNGFIGGNQTLEGAISMASKAVAWEGEV